MSTHPTIEVPPVAGPLVQAKTVHATVPPARRVHAEAPSCPEGSRLWATVCALVGVDLIGLGISAGCLGLLVVMTGQGAQWGETYEAILAVTCFVPLAYGIAGLYKVVDMHPAEELRQMAVITLLIGASGIAGAVVWAPGQVALTAFSVGVVVCVMPTVRVLGRILLARTEWWGVPVIVLSDEGAHSEAVITTLQRWPELGLRPVSVRYGDSVQDASIMKPDVASVWGAEGVQPPDELYSAGESHANGAGQPVSERRSADVFYSIRPEQAPLLAQQHHIPYAVLAMPTLSQHERTRLITHIGKFFRRLYVVPESLGAAALWTARSASQGLMGISVKHVRLSTGARIIKRTLDVVAAMIGGVIAAPLIATIAVLIKISSPGPVFFRQERMGLDGRCFTVLKFRTMYMYAEAKLQSILDTDAERRAQYEQYHKLNDDPRVTRIGVWLRRFSLDELPQLWNVLWGDMSLVGPRAYMPCELPKMNGLSRSVLQCPPGLTGLWQVSGRNNVDFSTRVDLDVHYMQNWTVWLDLYILLRTIPVVLTGEGAK